MTELAVGGFMLLALAVAIKPGPSRCFGWVYLPTLLLVPLAVQLELPGLPDLTARRAVALGLVAGVILTGRGRMLVPRWHWFDLLPAAAVLSFSISYGLSTDFKGFYHRLAVCSLDWYMPYLLTRAFMRDWVRARRVLLPLTLASGVLAFLAVYEARMGMRLGYAFWNALLGIGVPSYWAEGAGYRWGLLRATGVFLHPINLGLVFATLAPLAIVLWLLNRRLRLLAWAVALSCAAGCAAALSRGPMMVLAACSLLFPLIARRVLPLGLLALLIVVPAVPLLLDQGSKSVEFTERELQERGNTTSGRYRLALLLIYGDRIGEAGFFGDPEIIGSEFERASSIDNAYLYLYLIGGWVGGTLFITMTLASFVLGTRALTRARGSQRKILAATLASFAGVAGCMVDVWFAPDYAPLFFIVGALLLNQTRSAWFEARAPARRGDEAAQRPPAKLVRSGGQRTWAEPPPFAEAIRGRHTSRGRTPRA